MKILHSSRPALIDSEPQHNHNPFMNMDNENLESLMQENNGKTFFDVPPNQLNSPEAGAELFDTASLEAVHSQQQRIIQQHGRKNTKKMNKNQRKRHYQYLLSIARQELRKKKAKSKHN